MKELKDEFQELKYRAGALSNIMSAEDKLTSQTHVMANIKSKVVASEGMLEA